ncbi:MAG: hypothetical protein ACI91O_000823 [Candidatus Poriferisodalaceae bacterium]|jgi:hypothetical protein
MFMVNSGTDRRRMWRGPTKRERLYGLKDRSAAEIKAHQSQPKARPEQGRQVYRYD